ncbi:uncharacterized protein CC84DRAFT_1173477 [Paraphaeosphaeria sporulosa]|uniref:Protein kinase domain-containing protein n=1 Tax=Paraphaeosphaeria sporulosa TaxID=1460663 RepID=A0A177CLR2_9PLEO|nr:uncharacterized protein CC84DRAFT_1173477 [Paraphaeosphaeria sporulosa]OAG07882.1 hypothetical protein CC84DRAFT_1173477 [Paraphaeosphaeria sporulosa]
MAPSPEQQPHWSPTSPRSPSASINQQSDAVPDFLHHIKSNARWAVDDALPPPHRRSFVPISALRRYLTEGKIRRILASSLSSSTACSKVYKDYIRVFTILVYINKLPWLRRFLREQRLEDNFLPFVNDSDWPTDMREFFDQFVEAQWQFCAQDFESTRLNGDFRIDERIIIPIVEKRLIKKGPDSSAWEVDIHPDYNHLTERDECGNQPTNKFFLKSCSAENADLHHKEVEAYTILREQKDLLPYLAQFHGSWVQGRNYNMLLEYVGGGTLTRFMEHPETPVQVEHILHFWTGLLNLVIPLIRIHSLHHEEFGQLDIQGIHHDIKPDNILVTVAFGPSRFAVRFKLADLGLTDFDYKLERWNGTNKNVKGTQMFSPPELYVREGDSILERTILDARPTKDIWALGCVFSEAAAWLVLGREGLQMYRLRRAEATQQVEALQNTSHNGCFHNGTKVLQEVLDTHRKIRKECRRNDDITERVLALAEDMLGHESVRPTAVQVYQRSTSILDAARHVPEQSPTTVNRFSYPNVFITSATPDVNRRAPPECPPEVNRNGLGVSFSPVVESYSPAFAGPSSSLSVAPYKPYNFNGYDIYEHRNSRNSAVVPSERSRPFISRDATYEIHGLSPRPIGAHQISEQVIRTRQFGDFSAQKHPIEQNEEAVSNPTTPKASVMDTHEQPSHFSHPKLNGTSSPRTTLQPTERRSRFPEASLQEVEQWVKRTESYSRTPLLQGYHSLKPLNGRDHVFLFDDSGSMKDHWPAALRVFSTLGYIVKRKDPDGMEIRTTMDTSFKKLSKHRKPLLNALSSVGLRLGGQCDIGRTLSAILRDLHHEEKKSPTWTGFRWRKEKWGVNIYILTDGIWEEGDEWLPAIVDSINKLIESGMRKGQLGIQFIQFGSDPVGTERLRMLDEDLDEYGVSQDLIDTEPSTGNVYKMLLGAIDVTADGPKSKHTSTAAPTS